MKGLPFVLLFTAMTFFSWGAYGPMLHHGAQALNHDSLRAFVGVGLAYFLIAVIIPFMILKKSGEVGRWTVTGTLYSLVAGAVGAIGALGILLALGFGGAPLYVMPLVFGFAPIVNTLVTALLSRTFNQISLAFMVGVVMAAVGAGGVLAFKPTPKPAPPVAYFQAAATPQAEAVDSSAKSDKSESPPKPNIAKPTATESTATDSTAKEPATVAPAAETPPAVVLDEAAKSAATQAVEKLSSSQATDATEQLHAPAKKKVDYWGVLGSIVIAAVCWGSYGPMLHIGQGKMSGSRLRPFACVGIAYFIIAVAAPLVLIYSRGQDEGAWTGLGMGWSFIAGVAGAVGALGVILAFNAGGKPYYVMPLIFGFAPVINTFISVSEAGTWNLVSVYFWISLGVVIAGAVTVLINAPRPKPKPAPKAA